MLWEYRKRNGFLFWECQEYSVDTMVSAVLLSSNNLYSTSYKSNKYLKLNMVKTKLLISHYPPI